MKNIKKNTVRCSVKGCVARPMYRYNCGKHDEYMACANHDKTINPIDSKKWM